MNQPSDTPLEFDVVGIGNALVDVLVYESDDKVRSLDMVKGAMNLVDEDRSAFIYENVGPGVEISGGSVSNSTVGIACFGGRAAYMGKVRQDQLGRIFAHDIKANGVSFPTPPSTDGPSTGCCIILVTPDAERTMNTYLGASVDFSPADVDESVIARSGILFLEGYLFDPPAAQAAFWTAAEMAHAHGRRVAISLSDAFCVERHREAFRDLVEGHVDIVFANEQELCALYEVDDFDTAVATIRGSVEIAAVTRGAEGSYAITADDIVHIPAYPTEVVDTTAAGDLYAAGFLFGLSRQYPLVTCGRLGAAAASEVISHLGARPEVSLVDIAARILAEG